MRRKKGDIVRVRLSGNNSHIEVGLRHVGPKTSRKWMKQLAALEMKELKRVKELRKELSPELAPWVYGDSVGFVTPEGVEEVDQLSSSIVKEVFDSAKGDPVIDEASTRDAQLEELDRLDVIAELAKAAREAQAVEPAQFPVAADSGGAEPPEGQDSGSTV